MFQKPKYKKKILRTKQNKYKICSLLWNANVNSSLNFTFSYFLNAIVRSPTCMKNNFTTFLLMKLGDDDYTYTAIHHDASILSESFWLNDPKKNFKIEYHFIRNVFCLFEIVRVLPFIDVRMKNILIMFFFSLNFTLKL